MTTREINKSIQQGKYVYIGHSKVRIMRAATRHGVLMGKALSTGNWLPINRIEVI